jgi:hypothetical protein
MQSNSRGLMAIRWRAVVIVGVAIIIAGLVQSRDPAFARLRQVWFAPMDWFIRPEVGFGGSTDYMALFSAKSPDAIVSKINVFKVYGQFIHWASDDDLRHVLSELKQRHIALALETGLLTATDRCGRGVEGYDGPDAIKLVQRIAQLGGELAYITMDEPAFYGHIFSGANACRADFAEIARDAAKNLAAMKAIFPKVRAGDTEPVGPTPDDSQVKDYGRWADAFRAATGEPLAFSHADLQWKQAWQGPLKKFAAVLRERKIPLGVIYNGNDDDASDEAWVTHAAEHYRAVESGSHILPAQVVFQSWRAHPSHLLPDTDPGTFTYLLRRYLLPRR